ncbi:minor tail protein [Streptomyces phage Dryad]|nr:minor tail protein [Streptomyces phage Dryad]
MRKLAGMRLTPGMMRDNTIDAETNSGLVLPDTFLLNNFLGRKVNGKTEVYFSIMYLGANVTSNSAGNIADVLGPVLPPAWRPSETVIGVFDRSGTAKGSLTVVSSGLITFKTLSATAILAENHNLSASIGWLSQNN